MLLAPFAERDDGHFLDNGNRFALAWTGNRRPMLVVEWIPEAFRLAVEDDEDVLIDVTTNAELIDLIIPIPAVNHSQLGKRSPADGDGFAVEFVVYEFVVIEQTNRVCAGHAVDDKAQYAKFVVGLGRLTVTIGAPVNCEQS